jgi:hypothetical protein
MVEGAMELLTAVTKVTGTIKQAIHLERVTKTPLLSLNDHFQLSRNVDYFPPNLLPFRKQAGLQLKADYCFLVHLAQFDPYLQ